MISETQRVASKRWKAANPERVKAYGKAYQKRWRAKPENRARQRERAWKRYGILGMTEARYQEMLKLQQNLCAICGQSNKKRIRLAVDHDKATGLVRGLLCDLCNKALGQLGDTYENLKKALDYLARSKDKESNDWSAL